MKLLVAGGRDKWLENDGFYCLDAIIDQNKVDMFIQGGAKGVDTAAKQWADYRQIPVITVHAEWDLYGKKAGYLRNLKMSEMLNSSDIAVCFWGGRGTSMMKSILSYRGIFTYDFINRPEYVRYIIPNELFIPCNICNNPICIGHD